jgi:hypothetical protein
MTAKLPRGIANNNPFNIRKTDINWQGEVAGTDPDFECYATPEDGIRAGCKILLNYQRKLKLFTVQQMIDKFAPPVENDTGAYVAHVAKCMYVRPDQPIVLDANPRILELMANAIILHENGQNPYPKEVVWDGVQRALQS